MIRLALALVVLLALAGPAGAQVSVATGVATTSTALSSTYPISGLSFQPKCGVFFGVNRTDAADAEGSSSISIGIGVAGDALEERSVSIWSSDNAATSSSGGTKRNDAAFVVQASEAASDGWAALTAWVSDGATFTVNDSFSAGFKMGYLVLGGAGITNCKAGTFDIASGAGTGINVTDPGFQPDFVLIFNGTDASSDNAVSTPGRFSIGMVGTDSVNVGCAFTVRDGVTTPDTRRYCRTGSAIVQAAQTADALAVQANVTGFHSTGFTYDKTTPPSATQRWYYLAIKGGSHKVGASLTQTDTTTDIPISGLSFAPLAALVLTHGTSEQSSGTATAHSELSIGAGHGTGASQLSVCIQDEDKGGVSNTEGATAIQYGDIACNLSTADAIEGLMRIIAMDASSITFEMGDADPAQSWFGYWLVGAPAAACSGARLSLFGVGC